MKSRFYYRYIAPNIAAVALLGGLFQSRSLRWPRK